MRWKSFIAVANVGFPLLTLAADPPVNPYLTDSPWPMTHRNPYAQASSPHPGPTAYSQIQTRFLKGSAVPITLAHASLYKDGRRVLWGSTLSEVIKIDATEKQWNYVSRIGLEENKNKISGAYTLIDYEGNFFVPRGRKVFCFRDKISGDAISEAHLVDSYSIPYNQLNSNDEAIVGLNITYDGYLVFVTNHGLVAVISRNFKEAHYYRLLATQDVSNSIAVDEEGGIYVVSSTTMNRIQWTGSKLFLKWSSPYKSSEEQGDGRLGVGSGTTPTLMGTKEEDKFVVIADGQRLMHLVLFWRDEIPFGTQRVAAEVPITFGDSSATQSTTEQSVLVNGYGAVVVNNTYGKLPIQNIFPLVYDRLLIFFSNKEGIAPYGIEKFIWNPDEKRLEKAWSNPDISCPNSIPSMSTATGNIYCLGQHQESWTIEAVRWDTGQLDFRYILGNDAGYNSYYSATEIGWEGSLVSGTLGGAVQLSQH